MNGKKTSNILKMSVDGALVMHRWSPAVPDLVTMMCCLWHIYSIVPLRVRTPENSHTYHDLFQISQTRRRRESRTAFSCPLCAITIWPLRRGREHLIVVAVIITESATMLLDFQVGYSAEQKMDPTRGREKP